MLSGYVRVSQVGAREGEGFISPYVQEKAIRDWAKRTGAEVVVEPHELNVSGGTMDRPVFNSIMEKIRTGKSEGIVVYKLDRFARSLLGAITTPLPCRATPSPSCSSETPLQRLRDPGLMGAETTEVASGHCTMVSHSAETHELIVTAARAAVGPG